jgi:hypothetical protein
LPYRAKDEEGKVRGEREEERDERGKASGFPQSVHKVELR